MIVLVVPGDVGVPGSAQITNSTGLQPGVAVLVYQQLGQLVETLPALQTLEGRGVLQCLMQSSVSLQPSDGGGLYVTNLAPQTSRLLPFTVPL